MNKQKITLGMMSNALSWAGVTDYRYIVDSAASLGFGAIELGPAFPLTDDSLEYIQQSGLIVSDLIYCRNMLSDDAKLFAEYHREAADRIELAARYNIPQITLSAGIVKNRYQECYDAYEAIRILPEKSVDRFLELFIPILDHAAAKGVSVGIENCPLMGNWAISPAMWEVMFSSCGSPNLGLSFDPSHLVWQFIDLYQAAEAFAHKIWMVHAKDAVVDQKKLSQRGILTDFSWWEYRIPGRGEIDWERLLTILVRCGFNGVLSIELEDPEYSSTPDAVLSGLRKAKQHLDRICEQL